MLGDLAAATGLEVDVNAARDERLHRPFVVAALVFTLLLGAAWGAYLLTEIGLETSFQAVPPAHIIAHGTAELWGFVAILIVGIAMRYLASVTARPAPAVAARRFILLALVVGVLAGFAWSVAPNRLALLGPASGLALLGGAAGYLVSVYRRVSTRLGQVWARFVLVAAAWLFLWAGWTLFLYVHAGALGPAAFGANDRQVVMDLALFGLALGSIYGFGRKLLPGFLGVGKLRSGCFEVTFWLHNGGLLGLFVGRLMDLTPVVAVGLCTIGVGAAFYVAGLRGLRGQSAAAKPERGHPFLRRYVQLAFAWLLVSLVGFVVIALLEGPGGMGVPHAIHGAARHALTVGFLVTLILGVGQRLLPILGHTLIAWPGLVVPVFLLIAAGNFLRVASEVATSWWTPAYFVMPFSAVLELAALTLFAANAIRTMWPRPDLLLRTGQVARDSSVATLLAECPWIEDELIAWGFDYVSRVRQVPAELTVASFAEGNGFAPDQLIERINATLREHREAAKT
ncbi:NnrS family protein [bacterium]|nr:NnrS family protein [bacterium]